MFNNTSTNYILTEYLSYTWVRPVLLYVNPVVTLLGLIGNSFCFVTILCRRLYRKTPVFVFFAFLSLADFLYVLSDGIYSNEYLLGIQFHSRHDLACQFVLWIGHSGMICSSWTLVVAMAYKLYGLAWPLQLRKHDTKHAPYIVCSIIFVIFFSLATCVFWIKGVVTGSITSTVSVLMCYAPDRYIAATYGAVLMALYSLGPGAILIILSVGICVIFTRSYMQHVRLLTDTSEGNHGGKASSTFVAAKNSVAMLLPLSLIHVICTVPLLLYITIKASMYHGPEFYYMADRLWLLNHTMNVYVQLIVSSFYRKAMLPCLK